MIFIIRNPFEYFRQREIREACEVIDVDITASSIFSSIAMQISLGDPYLCDLDVWSHYEILWRDSAGDHVDRASMKTKWIEFCCDVHATGFNAIWDAYPEDVAKLVDMEEDNSPIIGTFHHPSECEVSITEDVMIVIKNDPDYEE